MPYFRNKNSDFKWVIDVIDSCTNTLQIQTTRKLINHYYSVHDDSDGCKKLVDILISKEKKIMQEK